MITILDTRTSLRDQMHATDVSPIARFQGHDNAIFDAIWLKNDTSVATASGDGTISVFDVKTTMRTSYCRGATGSVRCVRAFPSNPSVLISGSRDGSIRVFDTRERSVYNPSVCRSVYQNPVFTLERAHTPSENGVPSARKRRRMRNSGPLDAGGTASVTSLAFIPGRDQEVITAGAGDGCVKVWDLRGVSCGGRVARRSSGVCVAKAMPCVQRGEDEGSVQRARGIASLDVDSSGRRLIASATDSRIYVFDCNDIGIGHAQLLQGHIQTSFYIQAKFSPCGRYVASGSADSKTYIWDIESAGMKGSVNPRLQLDGHNGGDAAGVSWCQTDIFKLATCGDDATARVWKSKAGAEVIGTSADAISGSPCMGARRVLECEGKNKGHTKSSCSGLIRAGGSGRKRLRDSDIRSFFTSSPERRPEQMVS